mmetsp:Transcript_67971/g.196926  ORF Transcript_67971/g.196926 Transcript_67971/m.196926 type:complete len:268 (+) Transcript_67971:478-1281(+)
MVGALVLYINVHLRAHQESGHPHRLVEPSEQGNLEVCEPLRVDDDDRVEVRKPELVAQALRRMRASIETGHVPESQGRDARALLGSCCPIARHCPANGCGCGRHVVLADKGGASGHLVGHGLPQCAATTAAASVAAVRRHSALGDDLGDHGGAHRRRWRRQGPRRQWVGPRLCGAAIDPHRGRTCVAGPEAAEHVDEGGLAGTAGAHDSEVHGAAPLRAVDEWRWRLNCFWLPIVSVLAEVEPAQPGKNAEANNHDQIHRRRRHHRA